MARRPDPARLLAHVQADDLDAALQAGLMDYVPVAADGGRDPTALAEPLLAAQQALRRAWEARERYRARAVRLARREAERDARRAPAPAPDHKPALPSAAAAILARAKARAAASKGP